MQEVNCFFYLKYQSFTWGELKVRQNLFKNEECQKHDMNHQ